MPLNTIKSGNKVPNDINVVIEIPANSDPVKYEVDKNTETLFVDRFLGTPMQYPCNYGYVPCSLSADGDPVDVLVIAPHPIITGSVVNCRPIGMLQMTDEAGEDGKILAVPVERLTSQYDLVESFRDMSRNQIDKITHFFQHYKDLEHGKWVKIDGWVGVSEAKEEIVKSIERYQQEAMA